MTLGTMCSGDILRRYQRSEDAFSQNLTMNAAGEIEGNLQYLSTKEAREYGAKGIQRACQVFFSEPHGLDENFMFLHVSRADGSAVTPRMFEVVSTEEEGPPGATWLYIVYGLEISQRGLTIL